ncbi:exosome complex component 10-like [Antedon mediterranea]|uniref:exosome complex component 10-like n=1 Tax=Antedon mediterranea TaxID=105859 RepID=UPI003AF9B52D
METPSSRPNDNSKVPSSSTTAIESQSEEVNVYTQKALSLLVKATKAANGLPAPGDEYEYYSSFESFRHFRQTQSKKLLSRVNLLLKDNGIKGKLDPSHGHDVEEMVDTIIEANDLMLERVGIQLDIVSGIKTAESILPTTLNTPKVVIASWNRKNTDDTKSKTFHLMQARCIQRPQLSFKTKINNLNTPFVPIIKVKPNAQKPLNTSQDNVDISSVVESFIHKKRNLEAMTETENICSHPYEFEIEHLEYKPEQLLKVEQPGFPKLEDTPLTLVDTVEGLEELNNVLNGLSEFAVDLEAHMYRSYLGFVCLMQLSTGNHDYLVDTLALRSDMHILNQSFTDPTIVKVFHGADMDIVWLQRDFGVYVVNMFDTGQASRVLGLARHSLAHLLKLYCDVEAAKEYQLADWRIRPIPEEMKKYAREDTHYLLYIYHTMKNLLLERGNNNNNLLLSTLDRSKLVCLKRYEKPIFTEDSYLHTYRRSRKTLNRKQLFAYKLLYAWRDSVARVEDESIGYVLPNHMLFQIAENLPRESEGVLACCNPTPPLVRQYLAEVHGIVVQARMLQTSISQTANQDNCVTTFKPRKIEPLESLIYCPHDTTHLESCHQHQSADEGTISAENGMFLDGNGINGPPVRVAKPVITAIGNQSQTQIYKQSLVVKEKLRHILTTLKSPFEMYLPCNKPGQINSFLLASNKIVIPDVKKSQHTTPLSSNTQSPYVWRLKKVEVQTAVEKDKKITTQNDITRESQQDSGEVQNMDKEDTPLEPLRKKFKSKKRNPIASSSKTILEKYKDHDTQKPTAFKAFDYSQSDYSVFSSGVNKHSNVGKQFDPNRERHKFKSGTKRGPNPQSSRKSFTYKQQSNQKQKTKKWHNR